MYFYLNFSSKIKSHWGSWVYHQQTKSNNNNNKKPIHIIVFSSSCVYSGYEVVSYPITDQLSEEEVVAEDDKGDKGGKDDDGGKG